MKKLTIVFIVCALSLSCSKEDLANARPLTHCWNLVSRQDNTVDAVICGLTQAEITAHLAKYNLTQYYRAVKQ